MRWLVDECVAAALVHQLRAGGHDASYMADGGPGTIDAAVLQLAHEEGQLLLTEDRISAILFPGKDAGSRLSR
jgi:predicted nuclease of predicted toxin-antitoxin system